jgi:hypothetical protein
MPVLGINVTFESNDAAPIAVAEDAFGTWRAVEQAPRLISTHKVSFRIHVEEGDEGSGDHTVLRYRKPDFTRVILQTPLSVGVADAARREAVLYTTRGFVEDRQHFRYGALEALTFAVLTKLDRQPLQAACIARGETALLLAGRTGTGKSTLAYAAAHEGYAILAEDRVNIQMDPRLRVWGTPGWLHLPVDALRHFPELEGREPALRVNGTEMIAIRVADLEASPVLPVAQRAGICVIERGDGDDVGFETLDAGRLQKVMTQQIEPGFDAFAETIGDAIRMLTAHGGWRLRLGSDPRKAMKHIAAMFEVLGGN